MQKLAAFLVQTRPDILAICEVDSGDARSLATRFAMQWAYRGRQAILWNQVFEAGEVHDFYLPGRMRLYRRGFVRVDGRIASTSCTLASTQFSAGRDARVPEVRFARTQLRTAFSDALFFAHVPQGSLNLKDLGFEDAIPASDARERVYVRGLRRIDMRAIVATV